MAPNTLLCVVARDNRPLFSSDNSSESTRLLSVSYAALDMVEERQSSLKSGAASIFLGLVLQFDELRVYAHVTSTQVKLLLVTSGDKDIDQVRDDMMAIHALYVAAIQNPFQQPNHTVLSTRFAAGVNKILKIT